MKLTKGKLIATLIIVAVLTVAFWYGGNAPGLQGWTIRGQESGAVLEASPSAYRADESEVFAEKPGRGAVSSSQAESSAPTCSEPPGESEPADTPEPSPAPSGLDTRPGGTEGGMTAQEKVSAAAELAGDSSAGVEQGNKEYSEANGMVIDPETGKDRYLTDPVPEGKPLPVEPQNVEFSDVTHTCTLSVRCDTILENIDWLDPEKVELVPEDGVIFPATEVTFYEGESVFNVLQREMRKAGIHMEFVDTPMYNSAYIEGINNLYEFDCGELSGWMYKVNDWFPNYGCSRYQLQPGDVVEWVYTCDLGIDVGGYYAAGG